MKLYMGENAENRGTVTCPFCGAVDSVLHFGRQCPGFSLHDFLGLLWLDWTGHLPEADWWELEVAKDWRWMVMLACGYYSLYWWRYGIVRGELSASQSDAFRAHFRQQLRCLLDILACKPPDASPRSDGGATADGEWLEECEEPGRRFRVVITFPF